MDQILRDQLANKFHHRQSDNRYEAMLDRVLKREIAPHQAIEELIEGGEN
jgi:phytoene/squalene synthetase